VCIPNFLERWHILVEEIDSKWTWMYDERDRRIARDEKQNKEKN